MRDIDKFSHRVIDSKRALLGMCYILEPDLTLPGNRDIGYKNVMAVRDAVGGKQLLPLSSASFDNHAEWGVCQVGTAAAFVKPEDLDAEDGDLALFGAPGCFTWRGNVFGQNVGTVQRYRVLRNWNSYLGQFQLSTTFSNWNWYSNCGFGIEQFLKF